MHLQKNISEIESKLADSNTKLIIVTKTKPVEVLQRVYDLGYKTFGENRVQELAEKYETLPKDIEWHLIGHLQSNKVKYIAPFVSLIHAVESLSLLKEIDKQAFKNNRIINCLLQVYIAKEETKFGLSEYELFEILTQIDAFKNIKIIGLMGMATNTENQDIVRTEFKHLKSIFEKARAIQTHNIDLTEISMGMSNDFVIAKEEGSTYARVGSAVFK